MLFRIKKYLNFNSAAANEVQSLDFGKTLSAASCRYHRADHSIFFIESPTFSYVLSGTKYMLVNNKEYFLKAGDLLFIPGNSVVFTFIPQQVPGFESINVMTQDTGWSFNTLLNAQTNDAIIVSSALIKRSAPTQEKDFERFKKNVSTGTLSANEKKEDCIHFLSRLASSLISDTSFANDVKGSDFNEREKIKTVLLDNMYTAASVAAIADQCHMSVSTFKRKFEILFGVPPKTFKRRVCLQTAYFGLKTGNYKVSDLPDSVGFENFSHFSYAFKKQFKVSPSAIAGNNTNARGFTE